MVYKNIYVYVYIAPFFQIAFFLIPLLPRSGREGGNSIVISNCYVCDYDKWSFNIHTSPSLSLSQTHVYISLPQFSNSDTGFLVSKMDLFDGINE